MKLHAKLMLLAFSILLISPAQAQLTNTNGQQGSVTITTAVPFLLINPDAATMGVGMANIATEGSANSYIMNPSKMAFQQKGVNFSSTYSPWAAGLNLKLNYFSNSASVKIDEKHSFGVDTRIFDMGQVFYQDVNGGVSAVSNPIETSLGLMYAYRLNNHFSVGAALSFITSNFDVPNSSFKVGNGGMANISASYQNEKKSKNAEISYRVGLCVANLGPKISYVPGARFGSGNFLPTNFGLGGAMRMRLFKYLLLNPTIEMNKLLIPSSGGTANISYMKGVLTSGFDAKGGLKEELQEINAALGTEIGAFIPFNKAESSYLKAVLRLGYFNENEYKGNRKLFTTGLGAEVGFSKVKLGLNMGFLLPTTQNSPLQNTFSFGGNAAYAF